jgi:hypothetical protein
MEVSGKLHASAPYRGAHDSFLPVVLSVASPEGQAQTISKEKYYLEKR